MEKAVPASTSVELPREATSHDDVQSWNRPRRNTWRLAASFYTFMIMGMVDGAPGALLLSIESYYDITYTVVSLLFLSPVIGYVASSLLNNSFHRKLGQRGVAVLGSCCHIVTFTILSVHPPYPVLVITFTLSGFSTGVFDAAWCAWVSGLNKAGKIQGFLHACYAIGATIAPPIATAFITGSPRRWHHYYNVMLGLSGVELFLATSAFWDMSPTVYCNSHGADGGNQKGRTLEALKHKVTWMFAVFLLLYAGVEVGIAGWSITYLIKERHGSTHDSGVAGTGFWAGMVVGRVCLALVVHRVGERRSVTVLLVISIALNLLYWLIRNFAVSAVMIGLLGVSWGPLFPAAISLQATLTPSSLRVSAIGFVSGIAMTGAAIVPFVIGALAEKSGIKVLQPILLFLLSVMAIIWQMIPSEMIQLGNKRAAEHEESTLSNEQANGS